MNPSIIGKTIIREMVGSRKINPYFLTPANHINPINPGIRHR